MDTEASVTGHGARRGPTRFPPPAAFLAALALGFLVQHFDQVRIADSLYDRVLALPALLLGGSGLALAAWAILAFRRAGTPARPDRASRVLVTGGPFRYTRNPMYMGLSLVHAGISVAANAVWPIVFLVPALLVIRYYVIAREEDYLLARFETDYDVYRRSVPRWL